MGVIRIDPDCKYIVKVPSVSDIEQRRYMRILEEWWKERGSPFLVIGDDVELVRADFDAVAGWLEQWESELAPDLRADEHICPEAIMAELAELRRIIGAPRGILSQEADDGQVD